MTPTKAGLDELKAFWRASSSLFGTETWIPSPPIEDGQDYVPSQGWAEMIRKMYEVDPLVCPRCGGHMKIIAFITDYAVVDRIINHLKLTFVAERPPPPHMVSQEFLMDSETGTEYFS